MLCKGIIEEVSMQDNTAKVRVPILNKLADDLDGTPTDELSDALIVCSPGILPIYNVGDVVFVDFEQDEFEAPVILGLLLREEVLDTACDVNCDSLKNNVNAILSEDYSTNSGSDESGTAIKYKILDGDDLKVPGTIYAEGGVECEEDLVTNSDIRADNGILYAQGIELSQSTPYIDFHYGGSSSDWTVRLINDEENILSVKDGSFCVDEELTVNDGVTVGSGGIDSAGRIKSRIEFKLTNSEGSDQWSIRHGEISGSSSNLNIVWVGSTSVRG